MAQHSLSDRVAIVSMACTRFGEHFDRSADDLAVEAVTDALTGAGLAPDDIDAYWLGTYVSGISGMALARPLRLEGKPVTRVENMCATGSEALRQVRAVVGQDHPEHAGLLPHVDLMRKANRLGRKRKVSAQPQPVPQVPAPSPTPKPSSSPAPNPTLASQV